MIKIEIASDKTLPTDETHRLEAAVRAILVDAQILQATISLAIVDDPTIRVLNQQFLEHDYATDALSFVLEHDENAPGGALLEGEVIVSHETATRVAPEFQWTAEEELLLYVIHGTLHLIGHDDQTPNGAESMRQQEAVYLSRVGVAPTGVTSRSPAEGSMLVQSSKAPADSSSDHLATVAAEEDKEEKSLRSTASQGAVIK